MNAKEMVDKYNENYDEIIKVLSDIIENREITEGLQERFEEAYTNYNESYSETKKFLDDKKEASLEQKIEKLEKSKLDANLENVINVLNQNGLYNTFYIDEDGRIRVDGEQIHDLNRVKFDVDEQNKTIEALVSDGTVEVDGENIKLNVAYSRLKQSVEGITSTVTDLKSNIDTDYSTTEETKSMINQASDSITSTVSNTYVKQDNYDEDKTITEKSISEIKQTADKISWLIKSGTSESDMELTDKLFSLMTEKVLIDAKNIELNGSININEGKFMVQTNGNLKIGGLTGRLNGDGTQQGIFEVNSKGKVYSRNPDDANIYSIFDDGTIEVRNGDIRFKVNSNGIQIKNFGENGGELTMDDKNITTDSLTASGKVIANGGLRSNDYIRGISLAINNKKFNSESSTVNGSSQSRLFLGDTLIIYGRSSFTGLTANTTKTNAITFDKVGFVNPPVVIATVNSSSPHQSRIGTGSITTTGFNLYLNRTNTTDTNVFWVAIGERGGSDTFAD